MLALVKRLRLSDLTIALAEAYILQAAGAWLQRQTRAPKWMRRKLLPPWSFGQRSQLGVGLCAGRRGQNASEQNLQDSLAAKVSHCR